MITRKEVEHIAKLARLGLTEKEIRKFQKELSSILDYFKQLKKIDVSKTKPTFHSIQSISYGLGVLREDKGKKSNLKIVNKLIEAAPKKKKRHIKVKTVL